MVSRFSPIPCAALLLVLTSCAPTAPNLTVSCEGREDLKAGMVNIAIRAEGLKRDVGYTVTTPNEVIEQRAAAGEGIEAGFDKETEKLISKKQFKGTTLQAEHFVKGSKADEISVAFDLAEKEVVTAVCQ
ncbi:MAG: hypothetical protein WA885_12585 [Phormidesmis sp.]